MCRSRVYGPKQTNLWSLETYMVYFTLDIFFIFSYYTFNRRMLLISSVPRRWSNPDFVPDIAIVYLSLPSKTNYPHDYICCINSQFVTGSQLSTTESNWASINWVLTSEPLFQLKLLKRVSEMSIKYYVGQLYETLRLNSTSCMISETERKTKKKK